MHRLKNKDTEEEQGEEAQEIELTGVKISLFIFFL